MATQPLHANRLAPQRTPASSPPAFVEEYCTAQRGRHKGRIKAGAGGSERGRERGKGQKRRESEGGRRILKHVEITSVDHDPLLIKQAMHL